MVEIVAAYYRWLSATGLPELFVSDALGAILTGAQREFCHARPNQHEVTVKEYDFTQGDYPAEISQAIANRLGSLG